MSVIKKPDLTDPYGSLRNELTLKQPQLMVKQTYEHCRIVLMLLDQHFHHHVIIKQ